MAKKVKSLIPTTQIQLEGIVRNFRETNVRLILVRDDKSSDEVVWHVELCFANRVPRGQHKRKMSLRLEECLPCVFLPAGLKQYPRTWHAGIAAGQLAKFANLHLESDRNDAGKYDLQIELTIKPNSPRCHANFIATGVATAGSYERLFTKIA